MMLMNLTGLDGGTQADHLTAADRQSGELQNSASATKL